MKTTAYHPFRSPAAKETYLARYDEMAREWPISSEDKLVDTAYGRTFVRLSGPTEGPVNDGSSLVLLPGAGTTSLMWRLNIEALARHHRTYAVDSLVHTGCTGRSIATQAITGPDDAVAWLNDLFDALDLKDNINLLGASYGGWLASQYALHCPDRVNRMVLLAPAGTVLPFSRRYLLRTILLNVAPRRSSYRRFFKWAFKDLAQKDRQMLAAIADDFLISTQCFEPVNPRQLPSLTALDDAELRRIKAPTLFLIGENETLYSAQKAVQRLNEVAPHVQTELIPCAGHDLLLVQTEMVNQKIVDFLTQPRLPLRAVYHPAQSKTQ